MNKIIIEVGSTNTKIDIFDEEKVKRLEEITIPFKQNYKKNNLIVKSDADTLVNKINELKKKYKDIYMYVAQVFLGIYKMKKKIIF